MTSFSGECFYCNISVYLINSYIYNLYKCSIKFLSTLLGQHFLSCMLSSNRYIYFMIASRTETRKCIRANFKINRSYDQTYRASQSKQRKRIWIDWSLDFEHGTLFACRSCSQLLGTSSGQCIELQYRISATQPATAATINLPREYYQVYRILCHKRHISGIISPMHFSRE